MKGRLLRVFFEKLNLPIFNKISPVQSNLPKLISSALFPKSRQQQQQDGSLHRRLCAAPILARDHLLA
jgi:hypothetical protein